MPVITELEKKRFEKLEQQNLNLYASLRKCKNQVSSSKRKSVVLMVMLGVVVLGFCCYLFFGSWLNESAMEAELTQVESSNTKLKQENERLASLSQELEQALAREKDERKNNEDRAVANGWRNSHLVYSVQIGGYKKFTLQLISDSFLNMLEYEGDGMVKYSLGLFSRYSDAESFIRKLEIMGIECFPVARYKGKNISIRDAKRLQRSSNIHKAKS